MYSKIYNRPQERSEITYPYVWWDNTFTDKDIKKINNYFSTKEKSNSTVANSNGSLDFFTENPDIRRTKIVFDTPTEESCWIYERLNSAIETINDTFYNFTLNGYDCIQYGEYHASENGKYDWHMDMMMGNTNPPKSTRKLSISMLLNDDYEGGELQFSTGNPTEPVIPEVKPGRIIAFPSWMVHRVTPVTKGIRKSLVIWVSGPKFR